jgi:hypothetical protein
MSPGQVMRPRGLETSQAKAPIDHPTASTNQLTTIAMLITSGVAFS